MSDAVVQLTDPRALRAGAHPTRLKLLGVLRRVGPLTATQAGERIGERPAGCSFHLRPLAKGGLVEGAGGGGVRRAGAVGRARGGPPRWATNGRRAGRAASPTRRATCSPGSSSSVGSTRR